VSSLVMESNSNAQELHTRDSSALKWATTDEDWDTQRSLIKRLYLVEGKTLHEVMSIMEKEHNFKAT